MPLTPPGLIAALTPTLSSSGLIGVGIPQLSAGVAFGIINWIGVMKVSITATGTVGTGAVSTPLVVPAPGLIAAMLPVFASATFVGLAAPALAMGLANGLALGLSQGVITAPVAGVGTGSGIAKLVGSAVAPMIQGFLSAGLIGTRSVSLATAVGLGLDGFFTGFLQPVVVVGPSGPSPASSQAVGQLL